MAMSIAEAMSTVRKCQTELSSCSLATVAAAVDALVSSTTATYKREAQTYEALRGSEISSRDAAMNRQLLDLVRSRIVDQLLRPGPNGRWRLLDVGAGYGRDAIAFAREPDIDVVAVENSPAFLDALGRHQQSGELRDGKVLDADMRDLSAIRDEAFQCVRNHAALLHLPVVPYGLGADAAVAETRRILVDGGVFYCLVKYGTGVQIVDTGEGVGGRFFQLFTDETVTSLLQRHSFEIVHTQRSIEARPSGNVDWILTFSIAT